ncbi:hypothetical protein K2X40_00165 [Candidatus Babeliales bacterium]|nr:hypothetical protein [Candidatus Babeliales bacterium]
MVFLRVMVTLLLLSYSSAASPSGAAPIEEQIPPADYIRALWPYPRALPVLLANLPAFQKMCDVQNLAHGPYLAGSMALAAYQQMWLGLVARIADQERLIRAWQAMVRDGGAWSDDEAVGSESESEFGDDVEYSSEESGESSDCSYADNSGDE